MLGRRCWRCGRRCLSRLSTERPGPRVVRWAWPALSAFLGVAAVAGFGAAPGRIDWQPALAWHEPWRAWSAVAVHYSALHLAANGAGLLLVALLGGAARLPARSALAWCLAWPLTQFALLMRPDLVAGGGLSGVLHAGVAVAAVHLVCCAGGRRLVGAALLGGLLIKIAAEAPWGEPLRYPEGWDIAVAPALHAAGLAAGVACASLVEVGAGVGRRLRRRIDTRVSRAGS